MGDTDITTECLTLHLAGLQMLTGMRHSTPPQPTSMSMLNLVRMVALQDDLLYESLTVWETLWFAAQLRLPRTMSKAAKRDRVNAVLAALGLTRCRDTIIGEHIGWVGSRYQRMGSLRHQHTCSEV